ncbi:Molybdopterin or thiamine biosynthesis adenylyltransferase [Sulfitobacter marinus]|uniref:Molybdopterin-synthase adenylyltransferase n=1 Tax=Sulfitobacter marinus TaxID=394264 RepID=A0A1I6U391_9RHOB|nr:molybdopterin-synthase adenylyltransferase MoeB [Sulfitobacter marinus]SFS95936.1 Molybdopterin or thiamine biosynthesis adenylyltransferase [Sulfitobacter marinus]
MVLVAILAAVIWGAGAVIGSTRENRLKTLGVLFGAVIGVNLLLPEAHPLRAATGGSAAPWLLLTGFVVLAFVYGRGLQYLRRRAAPTEDGPSQKTGAFSETELNRYARHIVLREVGGSGQKALKNAKVLVVGAGGLGAPVLQYLAAAGVGTIGVIDDDVVENANLQRQVIHTDENIGMAKVFSAQMALEAQNPFVTIRPYHRRLDDEIAETLISDYDIVLDGTDNFETRYLVNRACVAAGVPLISGALSQWEGQLSVFDPARGAPCYQCVFPQAPAAHLAPSCAQAGVIGPLPGVIGSMMAVEAIKVITGAGAPLRGQMVIYDALYGENRVIGVSKRDDCTICGDIS